MGHPYMIMLVVLCVLFPCCCSVVVVVVDWCRPPLPISSPLFPLPLLSPAARGAAQHQPHNTQQHTQQEYKNNTDTRGSNKEHVYGGGIRIGVDGPPRGGSESAET